MKTKLLRAHESHSVALDGLRFLVLNSQNKINCDPFFSKSCILNED